MLQLRNSIRKLLELFTNGYVVVLFEIATTIMCNSTVVPPAVQDFAGAVGLCGPLELVQTQVSIPMRILEPEMKAVLAPAWMEMPDTTAMTECRVELGTMIYRLEAVQTPRGGQTLELVKKFDDQAKTTIDLIDTFSFGAKRTANTLLHNIDSLMNAFERASLKPRYSSVVHQIMTFEQSRINVWVKNFERDLTSLHEQTIGVQRSLEESDDLIKRIFTTAGIARSDAEKYLDGELPSEATHALLSTIFMGDETSGLVETASTAVEDFDKLVEANKQARAVVAKLSKRMKEMMSGIQAARDTPNEVQVIDMGMDEQVKMTVDILRGLKRGMEVESTER